MTLYTTPANRSLVWYLAMEEYLAEQVKEETLFFWTVSPTVIFGRHQVMHNEVNIDYCRQNNIAMYRRKSGGGCVYADRGNLMISYICPSPHSKQVFDHYLNFMAQTLQQIGYSAVLTTNNDILVNSSKVSGNASFAFPHSTIVHGTMLWNVDFDQLSAALTPPKEKLQKHGIQSVRQRVINLSSVPIIENRFNLHSIEDLQQAITNLLCDKTLTLSQQDIKQIDLIEQTYLNPDFLNDTI